MTSRTARTLMGLLAGAGACGVAQAAERTKLGAFIDVQQIADLQLHGPGADDVTYTELSGTASAQVNNRRIVASATYRLGYRFAEIGDLDKSLTQDGVMRMQAKVIDEWLSVDSGAIVTRSRVDPSGAAPSFNTGNAANLAQTYSVFVQPTVTHRIGDLGVAASYRYAYTRNESRDGTFSAGPAVDRFSSSRAQEATLSLGMQHTSLPFDWTVAAQYRAENTSNLASHFRAANLTGNVTVPIADTVAVVGSTGYERTETSERQALVDPLTGFPVRTNDGRFVVDPAGSRILTYEFDGMVANGGIAWRPSQRSRFEGRIGYRYGGLSLTGLVEMRPNARTGVSIVVTDQFNSFGQSLSSSLAGTPASLNLGASANSGSATQTCVVGQTAGSGQCIGGAVGQASARSYRERQVTGIFTRQMHQWVFSTNLGYTRRTYVDDPTLPLSLDGVVDQIIFGQMSMSGTLTRTSGVAFSFSGNMFKNGQVGAADVISGSINTSYYRTFGRGIRAQANLAVEASKQDGVTTDVSGRALVGVQYQF